VTEAFRGLRHPHQPNRRHCRRHLKPGPTVLKTTTVVLGGGHCGLAMSRRLANRSIDHVVLERGEVANSWPRSGGFAAVAYPQLDDTVARICLPRR
jgi:cation diffusion facilitator CzcD-associated flavoprotein CzcO